MASSRLTFAPFVGSGSACHTHECLDNQWTEASLVSQKQGPFLHYGSRHKKKTGGWFGSFGMWLALIGIGIILLLAGYFAFHHSSMSLAGSPTPLLR